MKTKYTKEQVDLLALNQKEKLNIYLQAFEYGDFYNRIEILENGKIKLMCDAFSRPRYYTRNGIEKEFNRCVKDKSCLEWLKDTIEDRKSGELITNWVA